LDLTLQVGRNCCIEQGVRNSERQRDGRLDDGISVGWWINRTSRMIPSVGRSGGMAAATSAGANARSTPMLRGAPLRPAVIAQEEPIGKRAARWNRREPPP